MATLSFPKENEEVPRFEHPYRQPPATIVIPSSNLQPAMDTTFDIMAAAIGKKHIQKIIFYSKETHKKNGRSNLHITMWFSPPPPSFSGSPLKV